MSLNRTESYARELQGIAAQAEQVQSNIDQMNGYVRIAQKAGNVEQINKLVGQREGAQVTLQLILDTLFERSKRDSWERAKEHVVDLFSRLRIAQGEFERWREQKALFDLRVTIGEEGFDRAAEERRMELQRKRYEQALKLAKDMEPETPVVLIP